MKRLWSPAVISADLEFWEEDLSDALKQFSVKLEKRPAWRHNKVGVFENTNAVLKS